MCYFLLSGMNAAVRSVVRMGIYVGFKVYAVHEVRKALANLWGNLKYPSFPRPDQTETMDGKSCYKILSGQV